MIKIISRKSDLAIIQAKLVGKSISRSNPSLSIEYLYKDTKGDIDLTTPLSKLPEIGVFTSDLRESLIENDADIAVHSWKDLPIKLEKGTSVVGTLPRADMRDVLLVKKNKIDSIKKNKLIKISSSSPRRSYNISAFLNKAVPFDLNEISFKDIRGNIPTRLNKFISDESDGIVLAKAALDRILENSDKNLKQKIISILNETLWMVLPLSKNPCAPAQGAIAIEVKDDSDKIIKLIQNINDVDTYNNVIIERSTLEEFGGGCHQKIGVSNEKTFFGDIFTIRGITDENTVLNTRKINRQNENENFWREINEDNIFPLNLDSYNFFTRKKIRKNISEVSELKNHNILATRSNVLDDITELNSTNNLWTSGIKTWYGLAKRGFWVNGTYDSVGENQDPGINHLSKNDKWLKLTHEDSMEFFIKDKLPTYKLIRNEINEDLSKKTHFYWMSGSAFLYALEKFPNIKDKFHSCGPGNTYEIIKKNVTEDNIKIFLSYNDWKNEITNEKD